MNVYIHGDGSVCDLYLISCYFYKSYYQMDFFNSSGETTFSLAPQMLWSKAEYFLHISADLKPKGDRASSRIYLQLP